MTEFYKTAKAVSMDVNGALTLEHLAFLSSDFTVRQKWIILLTEIFCSIYKYDCCCGNSNAPVVCRLNECSL